MNRQEKEQLINHYLNAYNSFDIDGMLDVLSSDIEFSNIADGEVNASASGLEEFRAIAEHGKALFSLREQTLTDYEEIEGMTSIKISYRAVLAVDLPNGMKAGQEINLKGRTEFTFENSKISAIKDIS